MDYGITRIIVQLRIVIQILSMVNNKNTLYIRERITLSQQ